MFMARRRRAQRPVVAAATGEAFDPLTIYNGGTLSNANRTFTGAGAVVDYGAFSLNTRSSGKYYVEGIIVTQYTGTAGIIFGVVDATSYGGQFFGFGTKQWGWFTKSGEIFNNGAAVTTIAGALVATDIACMAVDLDNNKIWFRKNSGNWNNDVLANQNPATNTGGVSIAGRAASAMYISAECAGSGALTLQAAGFTNTPPSGFGAWS